MKYKGLYLNIFVIAILLSALLKIRSRVCASPSHFPTQEVKSLGKEGFPYGQNIAHTFIGSRIITQFNPRNSQGENIELNQLASSLGYDHFNWVNYVEQDPYGITDQAGQQLKIPYNDPPKGGYRYDSADRFPFYWDLVKCDRCKPRHHFQNPHNLKQFELVFEDSPADYRLQPGEAIEFVTHLVGVKQYDLQQQTAEWEILHTFRWKLTNPHPTLSQVSLIESDVALNKLSRLLLSKMQLDGAVLKVTSNDE